jgi:hypothetical protein
MLLGINSLSLDELPRPCQIFMRKAHIEPLLPEIGGALHEVQPTQDSNLARVDD